jgi:hypothetical protein
MLFCAAHSATGAVFCGSVKPVRTMNGERCGITSVPAAITIIGTFASVATGAAANASGVSPNPARTVILSCTTISCAMRLVVSGASPVSSFRISSTLRPATVSPFFAMYRRQAAAICRPVDANGPVIGRIRPTLTGSAAQAKRGSAPSAAAPPMPCRTRRRDGEVRSFMGCLLG